MIRQLLFKTLLLEPRASFGRQNFLQIRRAQNVRSLSRIKRTATGITSLHQVVALKVFFQWASSTLDVQIDI